MQVMKINGSKSRNAKGIGGAMATIPGLRFATFFTMWIISIVISYMVGASWGGYYDTLSYCDIVSLSKLALSKAASPQTPTSTSTEKSMTSTISSSSLPSTKTSLAFQTKTNNNNYQHPDDNETPPVHPGWKPIHIYYGKTIASGGDGEDLSKWAYSQVLQDRITMALLDDQQKQQEQQNPQVQRRDATTANHNYYFVDLAANDAIQYSNTLTLEQNGWEGLCIEPNPIYWRRLATYRKCTTVAAVVGKHDLDQVKFRFDNNAWGGIVGYDNPDPAVAKDGGKKPSDQQEGIETHYTVSLSTLFAKFHVPPSIDYFSLDVEGAEELVMKSFPLDTYNFKVMTVERPQEGLVQLLNTYNYTHIANTSKWGETVWIHQPSFLLPSSFKTMEDYVDSIIKKVLQQVCRRNSKLKHSMKPRAKRWLCSKYKM